MFVLFNYFFLFLERLETNQQVFVCYSSRGLDSNKQVLLFLEGADVVEAMETYYITIVSDSICSFKSFLFSSCFCYAKRSFAAPFVRLAVQSTTSVCSKKTWLAVGPLLKVKLLVVYPFQTKKTKCLRAQLKPGKNSSPEEARHRHFLHSSTWTKTIRKMEPHN